MRTRTVAPIVGAVLFLGLALSARGEGADKPSRTAPPPFRCLTVVWHANFDVGNPAFDQEGGQVTWALEAKRETSLGRYEAFLTDGDGVEVAKVEVRFNPNRSPVKAGSKVQAILYLKGVNVGDVSRVLIRELR